MNVIWPSDGTVMADTALFVAKGAPHPNAALVLANHLISAEYQSLMSAQNGTYAPLARPLFVYAKTESFARPEVEAFVRYALENADSIAEETQYVPLTDEQKQEALAALDEAHAGTAAETTS